MQARHWSTSEGVRTMTNIRQPAAGDTQQTEVRVPIESMDVITRKPDAGRAESKFEKVVVLPNRDDKDPSNHAWADARFATDILSEHGLLFALLMPRSEERRVGKASGTRR